MEFSAPLPLPKQCETSTAEATTSILKYPKDINISFDNINYTTKIGFFKRNDKHILKNLSGEFRSRQLTAIVGPSGSGKSSLMDILSGYNVGKNVTGSVKVNGTIRDQKQFRHMSSYIMQDHIQHPLLTVKEAMKFSANLKIGKELSSEEKQFKINEILENLGLTDKINTMTEDLSGGQQKRLSIALEMVDSPQIMFFDEVTTGLDSSSSTQCIYLLKKLVMLGQTIICTIHQPSAAIFETFDHVYALADGHCIYQGCSKNLVPYLREFDLVCPKFNNPADFLIEVAHECPVHELVIKMENGRNKNYFKKQPEAFENGKNHTLPKLKATEINPISACVKRAKINARQILDPKNYCNDSDLYSTSFLRQFYYLYVRRLLLITRNPSLSIMRLVIHIVVAIFIGILYYQIGLSAKNMMNNFNYIFYTVMFLMYTAYSSLQTTFPSELPIVKMEHFNRWYSFTAYYLSLVFADIPIQVLCTVAYILITYFLTSQPFEWFRFIAFLMINLLCTFVAQGYGILVSSLFNVKWGTILGNFFISPFLIFSGFFIQFNHVQSWLHWFFHFSFLKYALEGGVYAIFGFQRKKLECDENGDDDKIQFCFFTDPNKLIREKGIQDCANNSTKKCADVMYEDQKTNFYIVIVALIMFIILFRVIAYCIMRYRLKH
ncbi:hypothetical protein PVAND_010960 [Polypedilum vanderplanki]|uniref:ABC transporter domain-containing protein n=1 Tax=Polypedilum vanderplanki TaxID=319348 RepID=A0A9J6CH49_POLVA|nr:hypothetical protein PVAND_010960 [Polypedilum vanderplanki]